MSAAIHSVADGISVQQFQVKFKKYSSNKQYYNIIPPS